jgi:Domain of unknown function (DUF6438)
VPGPAVSEISLEQTPCFGSCPVDKVVLRPDGTATYIGRRFVERIGTYEGKFAEGDFERLAGLMQSMKFFGMDDRYDRPITDHPSVITSAVLEGEVKRVVNYADAGPITLWGIEKAIRGVVAEIEWRKQE